MNDPNQPPANKKPNTSETEVDPNDLTTKDLDPPCDPSGDDNDDSQ